MNIANVEVEFLMALCSASTRADWEGFTDLSDVLSGRAEVIENVIWPDQPPMNHLSLATVDGEAVDIPF